MYKSMNNPKNAKLWGPIVWQFFHTLVCKIKENDFDFIIEKLCYFIKQLCFFLNCPNCAAHATIYINENLKIITNKESLIKFLYDFHNNVNIRKKKQLFNENFLNIYETNNLQDTYKQFIKVYKPTMYFMEDGRLHKKIQLVEKFDQWFMDNIDKFDE